MEAGGSGTFLTCRVGCICGLSERAEQEWLGARSRVGLCSILTLGCVSLNDWQLINNRYAAILVVFVSSDVGS